jgi:alpha-tubulin suppressor-like RCC1 family protein
MCILDRAGEVWCWGNNEFGQVGDGTRVSRAVPVRIIANP